MGNVTLRSIEGGKVDSRWDVEFSTALENRTGKYFIGRDMIEDNRQHIEKIYFWRFGSADYPTGMRERLLSLGMRIEVRVVGTLGRRVLPVRRRQRRTLHIDPFSVLHTELRAEDAVLCHDVGPITHPELFQPWVVTLYRQAFARIAEVRPRMAFDSASSRNVFRRLYGDTREMSVIYPPLRTEIESNAGTPVPEAGEQFLLTVGSIGNRKNQATMIRAFGRSGLAGRGVRYVLCGAREPGADRVERLAEETPGVRLLSYVTDAQLAWLYNRARGFVLMSRLEGFGVPVAESISRGLVPLVTKDSVLEEVAGEGALTADCDDVDAIAAGMRRLYDMSETERRSRLQGMHASLGRFTKQRVADDWHRVLAAA